VATIVTTGKTRRETLINIPLYIGTEQNCLPACITMLVHFYRVNRPDLKWGSSLRQNELDPVWDQVFRDMSDSSVLQTESSVREVTNRFDDVRKARGIPLTFRDPKEKVRGVVQLRSLISAGVPPIVMIDQERYLHGIDGAYAHSIVATGYKANTVIGHDPRLKANFHYPEDKFEEVWARKSFKTYLVLPIGTRVREFVAQKSLEEYGKNGRSM